jgi:hypothetical protein
MFQLLNVRALQGTLSRLGAVNVSENKCVSPIHPRFTIPPGLRSVKVNGLSWTGQDRANFWEGVIAASSGNLKASFPAAKLRDNNRDHYFKSIADSAELFCVPWALQQTEHPRCHRLTEVW